MSCDLQTTHYKTLLKEFTNYLRILGYSPGTVKLLPGYVKEFLISQEQKSLSGKGLRVTDITPADIQLHYEYLQNRPNKTQGGALSASIITSHLFALRIFFKWLEQAEIIHSNPISSLNFPYPEYQYRTALTQEEITKIYEATETLRDKAMLGLFYGCGLRRAEAEKLNTEDIKLREKILIVREGKGYKRRVIPLAEKVKDDLENYYLNERQFYIASPHLGGHRGAFMLNNKGERMTRNSYYPRLKYLLKKAGIEQKICLHQLRHSIATHLLEQGMSIEKVRDFLGHKYIDTTQRYTHVNQLKLF